VRALLYLISFLIGDNLAAVDNLDLSSDGLATIDRYATDSGIDLWAVSHRT
jgi:L-glyceraldehyde 3-phosphate reductase